MDLITAGFLQAGGAVTAALFAIAIWRTLNRQNSANRAEGAIYDLMSKEIARLSKALEEADEQLKVLRNECIEERQKHDEEMKELRELVKALQDKLIGDN